MAKMLLTLIAFLIISLASFGQIEQLQLYKNLYRTADSLNKIGHQFAVDNLTLQDAKQLDKELPAKFFEKADKLFKNSKFDDATFIFYLGAFRNNYYNKVANPKYHESDKLELADSLQVVVKMINLYMKTNIDNFNSALQFTSEYCATNDYTLCSKNKNPEYYSKLIDNYPILIKEFTANRTKYQKEFDDEKKSLIKLIEKSIDEYNKMTPEEKEKVNQQNMAPPTVLISFDFEQLNGGWTKYKINPKINDSIPKPILEYAMPCQLMKESLNKHPQNLELMNTFVSFVNYFSGDTLNIIMKNPNNIGIVGYRIIIIGDSCKVFFYGWSNTKPYGFGKYLEKDTAYREELLVSPKNI